MRSPQLVTALSATRRQTQKTDGEQRQWREDLKAGDLCDPPTRAAGPSLPANHTATVTHRSHRVATAVQPQGGALQLGPEGRVVLDHAGTVDEQQTG